MGFAKTCINFFVKPRMKKIESKYPYSQSFHLTNNVQRVVTHHIEPSTDGFRAEYHAMLTRPIVPMHARLSFVPMLILKHIVIWSGEECSLFPGVFNRQPCAAQGLWMIRWLCHLWLVDCLVLLWQRMKQGQSSISIEAGLAGFAGSHGLVKKHVWVAERSRFRSCESWEVDIYCNHAYGGLALRWNDWWSWN